MSAAVKSIYDPSCEEAFEFLKMLYGNSMTEKPKERCERSENAKKEDKDYAWAFIGLTEGKDSKILNGHVGLRTFRTLWKYLYDDHAMFVTPNQFISRNKRCEGTLEWLNAIVIDMDDTQDVVNSLERTSCFPDRATPALINKTTKGLHLWYLFDQPVKATKGNQERYIKIARAMAMVSGADQQCQSPVQYFRVPRNIQLSQPDARVSFTKLYYWAKQILKSKGSQTTSKTFKKGSGLLDTQAIKILLKGVSEGHRNSAAFSLATVFKAAAYSELDTYAKLAEWNQLNDPALKTSEIKAVVKSVFSKKSDHRLPLNRIREITGKSIHFGRIITKAIPRNKRIRSHYSERVQDLILFLEAQEQHLWQGSQKLLSEDSGIPLRSLKEVLSQVRRGDVAELGYESIGTGCKAITRIFLLREVVPQNESLKVSFVPQIEAVDGQSVPQSEFVPQENENNGYSVLQIEKKMAKMSSFVPQLVVASCQPKGLYHKKEYKKGELIKFVPQSRVNRGGINGVVPQVQPTRDSAKEVVPQIDQSCSKRRSKVLKFARRRGEINHDRP